MALPFAAIALPVLIGVAVFAGFDPRKKKDKPVANGEPPAPDESQIRCAHTYKLRDDNQAISVDGGPWMSEAQWIDEIYARTVDHPVVSFMLCSPDTVTLDAFEQLCAQMPEVEFFGVYPDQLGGQARDQLEVLCNQLGAVALATVNRMTDGVPTSYHGLMNDELILRPGDNIAEFFATIVETVQDGGGLIGVGVGE